MCALFALVWSCMVLFCGLQPCFSVTPPVFSLVTDSHRFAGSSPMVCHQSSLRHPQYRPPGLDISYNLVHSLDPNYTDFLFEILEPFCCHPACPVLSWPLCPFQCSTNTVLCPITQYAPRPASWTSYQNEFSNHAPVCFFQ